MKKISSTVFTKKLNENEEMTFAVSNSIPAGIVHDFVMEIKGHCIDVMVAAHKEHEAQVQQQECLDNGCNDGS